MPCITNFDSFGPYTYHHVIFCQKTMVYNSFLDCQSLLRHTVNDSIGFQFSVFFILSVLVCHLWRNASKNTHILGEHICRLIDRIPTLCACFVWTKPKAPCRLTSSTQLIAQWQMYHTAIIQMHVSLCCCT